MAKKSILETKGLFSGRINPLNYFCFVAFNFMYNMAIESYQHVDYAGLKMKALEKNDTEH